MLVAAQLTIKLRLWNYDTIKLHETFKNSELFVERKIKEQKKNYKNEIKDEFIRKRSKFNQRECGELVSGHLVRR